MTAPDPNWERSRERWRTAPPEWNHLTWGYILTGDAFVAKAAEHVHFSPERTILEIGPGYGRLLKSCLAQGVPFRHYRGLDLSEENCAHLRAEFPRPDISFQQGDVATATVGEPFDVVLSSLTFKHLYPSIEPALANLAAQLAPGGEVCIDLLEGTAERFDDVTFSRWYNRAEVLDILSRAGLTHVAFDSVEHDPEHVRLLVVARK